MQATGQQTTCIDSAQANQVTKIIACAGGGKTSTLELIARSMVMRSLYAAFNKVTAVEAQGRFPSHVKCQTTHSLAYQVFGTKLADKLTRPRGGYVNVAFTGSEIARAYNLEDFIPHATASAIGMFVRRTVERFEQSSSDELQKWHVPTNDMKKLLAERPEAHDYVFKAAQKLWKDRINYNSKVMASHDTYLKLYQLSKPILSFDVIYADELQDASPCVLDILLNQVEAGTKLVAVGDPFQAIYAWRGAINALEKIKGNQCLLSKSFRYGEGIAKVATAILDNKMHVEGREDLESVIGYDVVDKSKKHMYLFRTNAPLLLAAVDAVDQGEKVKIEIDVQDFVKMLQSAQALHRGEAKNVKHENIIPYASWKALRSEALESGGELRRIMIAVEDGSANHIIYVLENYRVPEDYLAIYTTAHKAKGREEDQVILADDFPTNYNSAGEWVGLIEAEMNLLYVAATRAKRVLQINKSVEEILDKHEIEYITVAPCRQEMSIKSAYN